MQICEIKLSPMPSFSSHQGTAHLKISYLHNKKKESEVYRVEVPDTKKTNAEANGSNGSGGGMGHGMGCDDCVVINLNTGRSVAGDIKVEYYAKPVMMRTKKLFSFTFNTYFVCDKRDDGAYHKRSQFIFFYFPFQLNHHFIVIFQKPTTTIHS